MSKTNNYSDDSIQILEGLDAVRKRPGMYIGSTDVRGLHHLVYEIADNAVDEILNGYGDEINIRLNEDASISITDNGPGIPEDIKNRIFEPFFTTKEIGKGTGLGLDVVSRIAQQHGGSVKVDTVPGRTSFVLCFPIDK